MLFDAHQVLGFGGTARPDYPTAAALLERMDRLGIARAVVGHAAARRTHAGWANGQLLTELAATPAAAGRLIPALSISPCLVYERESLGLLREMMEATGTRALQYPRMQGNWTLAQVEPLLEELRPLRPVLFLDARVDGFEQADLLACTERFPELSIVYSGLMWPMLITALELLRQRENVYLNTAWMHSYGDLEMVAERYGAERLVFGTGFQAHAGAAILRLVDARLSEAERELVAHGNLERLLGLEPAADAVEPAASLPGVWRQAVSAQPLELDVVDAHGHIGPLGMYLLRSPDPAEHVREMLGSMDRLGINTTVSSGGHALFSDCVAGNFELEKLLLPHADRLKGYVAFNPYAADELAERLDEYFAGPVFVGFKILADYWQVPVTDPRLEPAWAYAHAHRLPILVHTWVSAHNAPDMLDEIAGQYPDASFLLAHSGGPDREPAVRLAEAHPNVYLEFCGSFTAPADWAETVARVGADRVVFGTDGIAHDQAWELGRLLSQDLPEGSFPPILGGNMRALLARRI